MELTPAYGRDYKNKKEVEAAILADKDFVICDFFGGQDGRYANLQDLKDHGEILVRYKRLTQVASFNFKKLYVKQQKLKQAVQAFQEETDEGQF